MPRWIATFIAASLTVFLAFVGTANAQAAL